MTSSSLLTHGSTARHLMAETSVSEDRFDSSVVSGEIIYNELRTIYQPSYNAIVTPGRFGLRYLREPQGLASTSEALVPDLTMYPREYHIYAKCNLIHILILDLAMCAEGMPVKPQRNSTQLHKRNQSQPTFDPEREFPHTPILSLRAHEPSNTPGTQGQVCEQQHVIALAHAPATVQGINLVPITRLPDRLRHLFSFVLFNAIQSKVFDAVYESNDNVVVSAPTGSGKTTIMELAICRLVSLAAQGSYKVIYQAPTKALCSERKRFYFLH